MSNSRRRVKLFVLDEERQWSDRGTGHVSAIYTDQDNESKGIMLLVRSEEDGEYFGYDVMKLEKEGER